MLAASLLPTSYAPVSSAVLPSQMLAQISAQSGIGYYAPVAAMGTPISGNGRQPQGAEARASITAATPAVMGPDGLQFAALGPVRRDYGYSSAFLAQMLDQGDGTDSFTQALTLPGTQRVPYLPSAAGVPAPPQPIFDLVKRAEPQPLPKEIPASVPINESIAALPIVSAQVQSVRVAESLPGVAAPSPALSRAPGAALGERPAPTRAKSGMQAYQTSQQRLMPQSAQTKHGVDPVDAVM